MAIVEPGKGRAVIEQDGTGLRITIPASMHIGTTTVLTLWLIFWAAGEIVIARTLFQGFAEGPSAAQMLFMIIWPAVWTLMGAWSAGLLLWNVIGKEITELNPTMLKHRKQISIFNRSREYNVANIVHLRPTLSLPSSFWFYRLTLALLTFKDGAISFEYGHDTRYLASGLEEADAKYVIEHMCRQVKSLRVVTATDATSMAAIAPASDRVLVENNDTKLRITMRTDPLPVVKAMLGIFLAFWIYAEFSAIRALFNGAPLEGEHFQLLWMTEQTERGSDFTRFMMLWLASGAMIGAALGGLFLWSVAGKEIIELDSTTLRRIRQIPVFGYSEKYSVADISDLRPAPFMPSLKNTVQKFSVWSFTGGAILFDYGRSTYRLGSELSEADAKYVIGEMCKRVKSLCI